jgi:hypothetical protein
VGTSFYKNLFATDLNTHTSVPDSTKLFLVNQFTCRTLAVRGVTVLPGQVTSGTAVKKMGTQEKTLQQKGMPWGLERPATALDWCSAELKSARHGQKSARHGHC